MSEKYEKNLEFPLDEKAYEIGVLVLEKLLLKNKEAFDLFCKNCFDFSVQNYLEGNSILEKRKNAKKINPTIGKLFSRHIISLLGFYVFKQTPSKNRLNNDVIVDYGVSLLSESNPQGVLIKLKEMFLLAEKDYDSIVDERKKYRKILKDLFKNQEIDEFDFDPSPIGRINKFNEIGSTEFPSLLENNRMFPAFLGSEVYSEVDLFKNHSPFEVALLNSDILKNNLNLPNFNFLISINRLKDTISRLTKVHTEILDQEILKKFPKTKKLKVNFYLNEKDMSDYSFRTSKNDTLNSDFDILSSCFELFLAIKNSNRLNSESLSMLEFGELTSHLRELFTYLKFLDSFNQEKEKTLSLEKFDGLNFIKKMLKWLGDFSNEPYLIQVLQKMLDSEIEFFCNELKNGDILIRTGLDGSGVSSKLEHNKIPSELEIILNLDKNQSISGIQAKISKELPNLIDQKIKTSIPEAELRLIKDTSGSIISTSAFVVNTGLRERIKSVLEVSKYWKEKNVAEDAQRAFIDYIIYYIHHLYSFIKNPNLSADQIINDFINRFSLKEVYAENDKSIQKIVPQKKTGSEYVFQYEATINSPEYLDYDKKSSIVFDLFKGELSRLSRPRVPSDLLEQYPLSSYSGFLISMRILGAKETINRIFELPEQDFQRIISDEKNFDLVKIQKRILPLKIEQIDKIDTKKAKLPYMSLSHFIKYYGLKNIKESLSGQFETKKFNQYFRKIFLEGAYELSEFANQKSKDHKINLNDFSDYRKSSKRSGFEHLTDFIELYHIGELLGIDFTPFDMIKFKNELSKIIKNTKFASKVLPILDKKIAITDLYCKYDGKAQTEDVFSPSVIEVYRQILMSIKHIRSVYEDLQIDLNIYNDQEKAEKLVGNIIEKGITESYIKNLIDKNCFFSNVKIREIWLKKLKNKLFFQEKDVELYSKKFKYILSILGVFNYLNKKTHFSEEQTQFLEELINGTNLKSFISVFSTLCAKKVQRQKIENAEKSFINDFIKEVLPV